MLDFRLSQLRSFLKLAETLNYARAARVLYMAQPTLSGQIKSLEQTFGIQLFERTRQRVVLTSAGEKLAVSAQRLLQDLERIHCEMISMEAQVPIRICSSQSGQFELVPRLLRELSTRATPQPIEFHSLVPSLRLDALSKGKVDLLLMVPPIRVDGVSYRAIVKETLIAALPAREPFLSMESISIYDFGKETLLIPSVAQCANCQRQNLEMLAKFGLKPETVEGPIDQNSRMAMIAGGGVVGFAGDSAWNSHFPGVILLPFQESLITQQLGVAWRTDDNSPTILNLLATIGAIKLPRKQLFRIGSPPVGTEQHVVSAAMPVVEMLPA